MHIAIGHIKRDQGIPAADFYERSDVDEGEAVVGEEAHCPADGWGGGGDVAEGGQAVRVDGLVV